MPRGKKATGIAKGRKGTYEALKSQKGKTSAAKIANAGKTQKGRKAMAQKAARTRRGR